MIADRTNDEYRPVRGLESLQTRGQEEWWSPEPPRDERATWQALMATLLVWREDASSKLAQELLEGFTRETRRSQLYAPTPMAEEIERARRFLAWGDNWDGEGSPGFSESLWERVGRFLKRLDKELAPGAPTPKIGPGPDGSFDVDWSTGSVDVLVNFPKDGPVTYAMRRIDGSTSRGTLDPERENGGLFEWMLSQ